MATARLYESRFKDKTWLKEKKRLLKVWKSLTLMVQVLNCSALQWQYKWSTGSVHIIFIYHECAYWKKSYFVFCWPLIWLVIVDILGGGGLLKCWMALLWYILPCHALIHSYPPTPLTALFHVYISLTVTFFQCCSLKSLGCLFTGVWGIAALWQGMVTNRDLMIVPQHGAPPHLISRPRQSRHP